MRENKPGVATTTLRLPREVLAQVQAAAAAQDRSLNGQIVAILRQAVTAQQQHASQGSAT